MSGEDGQIRLHGRQMAYGGLERFKIPAVEIVASEGIGKEGVTGQKGIACAVAYRARRVAGGVDDLNTGLSQRNTVAVNQRSIGGTEGAVLPEKEGKRVLHAIGQQDLIRFVNISRSRGGVTQRIQRQDMVEMSVCQQDSIRRCAGKLDSAKDCRNGNAGIDDQRVTLVLNQIAVCHRRARTDRNNLHNAHSFILLLSKYYSTKSVSIQPNRIVALLL